MKKFLIYLIVILITAKVHGQTSTTIHVNGAADKFYPVLFSDPNWYISAPTEISIGRSDVHTDALWAGSVIANFKYHTTNYGHGSQFIEADIFQSGSHIAGWEDATGSNANQQIIIWLKGTLSYTVNSKNTIAIKIYDGVLNPLPFMEQGGSARTYKTAVESYANQSGVSHPGNVYYTGGGKSYFMGYVGIGTTDPTSKLSVNGNIRAKEVKVETANWPDYVFKKEYELPSLQSTEQHIREKGHLPGIPSASDVQANGVNLGEMNAKLLQKIEELTLHLIQKDLDIKKLTKRMDSMETKLAKYEK